MQQIHASGAVASIRDTALRDQLQSRRQRLQAALAVEHPGQQITELLEQVDVALAKMDAGTFGLCETCHETIENDRLLANPLCRNCLDHLSPAEARALERDLDLAFEVQRGLLPKPSCTIDGWKIAYHYEPAGAVSGDYCDVIPLENHAALFLVGDISGKGIAASLLMAHLHAIFRSLATARRPVADLVSGANRVFCQGAFSSHFATLVCGCIDPDGTVEICNAGHCLPLHVGRHGVRFIEPTGVPLGVLGDWVYASHKLRLEAGDSLVVYTDGLSEAFNDDNHQYGAQRLATLLRQKPASAPHDLLTVVLTDLRAFRSQGHRLDDLTVMVIQRTLAGSTS